MHWVSINVAVHDKNQYIVYFDCITTFNELYCRTSTRGWGSTISSSQTHQISTHLQSMYEPHPQWKFNNTVVESDELKVRYRIIASISDCHKCVLFRMSDCWSCSNKSSHQNKKLSQTRTDYNWLFLVLELPTRCKWGTAQHTIVYTQSWLTSSSSLCCCSASSLSYSGR